MTSYRPTAITAGALFAAAAAVVAFWPVGFVARSPGPAVDLLGVAQDRPVLQVAGPATYPSTGGILLTTVDQTPADRSLRLLPALLDHLLPEREVLPRADVYQADDTAQGVAQQRADGLRQAQEAAVVAALRQVEHDTGAGDRAPLVKESVAVGGIVTGGPADGRLQPGDVLVSLGDQPVATVAQVTAAIRLDNAVGTNLPVTVFRAGQGNVGLTIELGKSQLNLPTMGVTWRQRYDYSAYLRSVGLNLDPGTGDEANGLALALALYDLLSPRNLAGDRVIAAVGGLTLADAVPAAPDLADPTGIASVDAVPGIRQHVVSATDHGASLVLLPRGNCADVDGLASSARLVPVSTFREAVDTLARLATGGDLSSVPGCGPIS